MERSRHRQAADLTCTALFTALLAVCTWICVPAGPVPFTLQTLGVFLALGTLGGRRGPRAVLAYLLLGLAGLPVFSGLQGGPGVLLGATGGYITGFLAAALLYWLITARLGESAPVMACAMGLGLLACYALGTAWFLLIGRGGGDPVGLVAALGLCVAPFAIPDLIKLALALALSRRLRDCLRGTIL